MARLLASTFITLAFAACAEAGDGPEATPCRALGSHGGSVLWLAFAPDQHGNVLASASRDDTIVMWDVRSGVPEPRIRTIRGHTDDVYSIAYSPDGATLASASADGTVRLWDPGSGAERRVL